MTEFCQLWLSCASKAEADAIASALLDKKLIICAKQIPVSSAYWWKGKVELDSEVLLILESKLDNFDAVESVVAELHSYETFVLQAIPLAKVSKSATQWMEENLNHE